MLLSPSLKSAEVAKIENRDRGQRTEVTGQRSEFRRLRIRHRQTRIELSIPGFRSLISDLSHSMSPKKIALWFLIVSVALSAALGSLPILTGNFGDLRCN